MQKKKQTCCFFVDGLLTFRRSLNTMREKSLFILQFLSAFNGLKPCQQGCYLLAQSSYLNSANFSSFLAGGEGRRWEDSHAVLTQVLLFVCHSVMQCLGGLIGDASLFILGMIYCSGGRAVPQPRYRSGKVGRDFARAAVCVSHDKLDLNPLPVASRLLISLFGSSPF